MLQHRAPQDAPTESASDYSQKGRPGQIARPLLPAILNLWPMASRNVRRPTNVSRNSKPSTEQLSSDQSPLKEWVVVDGDAPAGCCILLQVLQDDTGKKEQASQDRNPNSPAFMRGIQSRRPLSSPLRSSKLPLVLKVPGAKRGSERSFASAYAKVLPLFGRPRSWSLLCSGPDRFRRLACRVPA